jgi:hypothetical protein
VPSTFADTLQRLLDAGGTAVATPYALKGILVFMKANDISTLPELRETVVQKHNLTNSVREKLDILQILRAAEEIDRKLNPRVQQRERMNRGWERS